VSAEAATADEATILVCPTPDSWVEAAVANWRQLLRDHAGLEKKAASTALALMFSYAEDRGLAVALSRLAREELRHFEQVERMMAQLDIPHVRQRPGRYASGLRSRVRTCEPGRKLDLLLCSALIEARSAERFRLLAPRLPQPVALLYQQLERSEARHLESYLRFAQAAAPGTVWRTRLTELAEHEAQLVIQLAGVGLFLG
jgi:tRNA-(ms[2]io[6]A)-hydroxylase